MSMLTPKQKFRAWGRRQLYSLFSSLGSLVQHWTGTLMTVLVLGIAMALPLGLAVVMKNLHGMDFRQEDWGSLSVFLQPAADETEARALAAAAEERFRVSVVLISPEQGMAEFLERSGLREAADLFETNPLPWVLLVTPPSGATPVDQMAAAVADWFGGQGAVEAVQLDHKWMQRLAGWVALGDAFVRLLSAVLSIAVVLVVANTIRLDVANRAGEIKVLNMVGAPNGYIRQPFLYSGFWYGLMGAALALLLLAVALAYLQSPVERLQDAYGNAIRLQGPGVSGAAVVLVAGGLLGLAGAWWSVQRYLRQFRVEDPVRRKSS
ncbi:MAG: permease-like cell division protein FtsX [Xanthomonadales bacterium]